MKANFAPGPSQLYFTVKDHLKTAFVEGIPSMSHRSKEFETIFAKATNGLRKLLSVPDSFHIFFTGSATEVWERSIQNLVANDSYHFVNGAFSKRYFEIAQQLGKNAVKVEAAAGKAFDQYDIPSNVELIALTHNETSTGVSLPMNFIHSFRDKYPNALIVVDAVSSLPYPAFDFTKIDSLFFSVQKGFGLPAGLGVWIVNDKCLKKADSLLSKGISIGTYHNLPTLYANAKKNQTPETPNVLSIFLLAQVVEDFLQRGIHAIRKETEYKAAVLYGAVKNISYAKAFVSDPAIQSQSVVVIDCNEHLERITKALNEKGLMPGDGYGEFKKTHLRFANFPTHSKEHFELLADTLSELKI